MSVPAHLLLGPTRHGVRILAAQLAEEVGAHRQTWHEAARFARVHVHLNARLLEESARHPLVAVRWLAGRTRLTVTLHDVPQHSDGAGFQRRRATYQEIVAAADGWAVSSRHEHRLVREHLDPPTSGLVAPLPVLAGERTPPAGPPLAAPAGPTAAIVGFVYPGKGHGELIDAAASVRDTARITVLALGDVAPGHESLADELRATALARGVDFIITGHLDAVQMSAWLHRVDVAVCGHRNVSASGSLNSWIAARRRPLVREGRYAQEMEALRPHCSRRYADADLPRCLLEELASPRSTWLARDVDTRPHLADTAGAYLEWWRTA